MSNRETYPASQSPLTGDIDGTAGETQITVTGWQGNPIDPGFPVDMAEPFYDAVNEAWHFRLPGNIAVIINATPDSLNNLLGGTVLSDDYEFLVDNVGLEVLTGWSHGFSSQVFVDGVGVP